VSKNQVRNCAYRAWPWGWRSICEAGLPRVDWNGFFSTNFANSSSNLSSTCCRIAAPRVLVRPCPNPTVSRCVSPNFGHRSFTGLAVRFRAVNRGSTTSPQPGKFFAYERSSGCSPDLFTGKTPDGKGPATPTRSRFSRRRSGPGSPGQKPACLQSQGLALGDPG
jgi:hypothetical protein